MKNHSCSFLSRLALPGLMSLILLSPAIARADLFEVSGTATHISGGALGSCAGGATCPFSGMFTVDTTTGTIEKTGLEVTLPGLPTFDDLLSSNGSGGIWEIQVKNSSGDVVALGFDTEPNPDSLVGFTGGSGVFSSELNGNYAVNSDFTITPVPEPTSLLLLAGVIGWVVFDLKRRVGKKSVIHTLDSDRFADRGTI